MKKLLLCFILLQLINTTAAGFEQFDTTPIDFLENLKDKKMVDDLEYNQILRQFEDREITTLKEILIATNDAISYSTVLDKNVTPELHATVFAEIASISPELGKIDANVSMFTETAWRKRDVFLISYEFNGLRYQSTVSYLWLFPNRIWHYYPILNRTLADINSSKRFYGFDIDENHDAILLLNKEQGEYLSKINRLGIYDRSHETLTTIQMQNVLDDLNTIGLLNEIDPVALKEHEEYIFRNTFTHSSRLILALPVTYYFDTETSNFENPYQEITVELQKISRGNFTPTNIQDNYEYDTTSFFSFQINGKKYEKELSNSGDWLDTSFIELLNNALKENNIDGRFYYILPDYVDQGVEVIFLNQSQYEFVVRKNYLNLGQETNAAQIGQNFEEIAAKEFEGQIIARNVFPNNENNILNLRNVAIFLIIVLFIFRKLAQNRPK